MEEPIIKEGVYELEIIKIKIIKFSFTRAKKANGNLRLNIWKRFDVRNI